MDRPSVPSAAVASPSRADRRDHVDSGGYSAQPHPDRCSMRQDCDQLDAGDWRYHDCVLYRGT